MAENRITRRHLLGGILGIGAIAGLAGCSARTPTPGTPAASPTRSLTGKVRDLSLTARPVQVDLGGRKVATWAYGETVPGKAFRASAGDRVRVAFTNDLPDPTSVHWHGLAIRNDMDGVPGLTTPEVPPGGKFAFDFVVPDPGTHWFHPHTGLQLDRGLYTPFIIDDPAEPGNYDHEWIVVLDDWTDGVGRSPEQIMADLMAAGANGNGSMMAGSNMDGHMMGGDMMGGDMMGGGTDGGMMGGGMMGDDMMGNSGDVQYPLYLINGRPSNDPDTLTAKPGDKVRLRVINAGADTIFHLTLDRHDLSITHTDGYPVNPVTTQVLRIGMGERYDALITLADGVFPLVAQPVGKQGLARAIIRTSSGAAPAADYRPANLDGRPLTADALRAAPGAALPARDPDSVQPLALAGTMGPYRWTINGHTYDQTAPLTITAGQTGRLAITNHSMMTHPIHLHGHTFQLGPAGGSGPRKDTVLVPPMGSVKVDFAANNPGKWMIHCHNIYHAEAGMMTRLEYS